MRDTECEKCKVNKYCGTCITCEQAKEMYQQGRADAVDDFAKYIREKVLFEEKWLMDCKSSNANTKIAFSSIMTFINSVAEELKKVEIQ